MDYTILPTVNATLNSIAAILLVRGWVLIKRRDFEAHKKTMLAAFATSAIFLVSYLVYHYNVGSVKFTGTGAIRVVYFAILISHIVLAAVITPLALMTLYRAWKNQLDRHRRLARITLPMWLYVSVTGVAVYAMLYHL
jgi:putative membrane protein